MINNIRFKIIAGKINKILEFYTIFAPKMPDYIIRQRDRGQAEAKCLRPRPKLQAEAEAKSLRSRPRSMPKFWLPKFWPRGLNITVINQRHALHTTPHYMKISSRSDCVVVVRRFHYLDVIDYAKWRASRRHAVDNPRDMPLDSYCSYLYFIFIEG